ncbi:DUF2975 domain-containing protein [Brachybacterium hainanense]|uniref:DUF2975 domain-containing protein n=1 Tax=Brachybacterium hainanense TaxID=1541174 RepID=A0ABV6RB75_9MICO
MNVVSVQVLRVIVVIALIGSLVIQLGFIPLAWLEARGESPLVTVLAVIGLLGVLALQVIGVCILRLLGMVRRGRVFSPRAFSFVDAITAALGVGAVLVLAIAVVGAIANRTSAGDVVAPGVVGMVCGLALVVAGVCLVVHVQRQLLAQATRTLQRAEQLQSELDEVV